MNKNNVVKFPKSKRSLPITDLSMDKIKESMPEASTIKKLIGWLWVVIRLPLFFILYWLRLPIIILCNFISIPMMFAWLFALYAFPDKSEMIFGFGIVSFSAFLIGWTYDFILMALSPQQMMRNL